MVIYGCSGDNAGPGLAGSTVTAGTADAKGSAGAATAVMTGSSSTPPWAIGDQASVAMPWSSP